jgi:uncharacterized membrane protein YbhN (UPF0104 family)
MQLRRLAPFLGLAVFVLALWVLHREFAHLHLRDVTAQLEKLPTSSLVAAIGLTIVSYLVLTGYDALSLRFLNRRLGYRRSSLASFLGYSISQNVGLTLFSGAPIRFRLYSAWGLSAIEVATIVAFNGLTFWLGLLTVGGIAFTIGGGAPPATLHLPLPSLRPLGVLFLMLVLGYLASCLWLRGPRRIGRWEVEPPLSASPSCNWSSRPRTGRCRRACCGSCCLPSSASASCTFWRSSCSPRSSAW